MIQKGDWKKREKNKFSHILPMYNFLANCQANSLINKTNQYGIACYRFFIRLATAFNFIDFHYFYVTKRRVNDANK